MLAEFEPASETQLGDLSVGILGVSRGHHRLREIAVHSMVDLTAKTRLERVLASKARVTHEQLALSAGDLFDFYRPPEVKDESGRRGLPKLVSVEPPAVVRWQDRFIHVRTQDVRIALVRMAFVSEDWGRSVFYLTDKNHKRYHKAAPDPPIHKLQIAAESHQHHVVRLGWLYHDGWRQTKETQFLS